VLLGGLCGPDGGGELDEHPARMPSDMMAAKQWAAHRRGMDSRICGTWNWRPRSVSDGN
jgi:hypothetical protein